MTGELQRARRANDFLVGITVILVTIAVIGTVLWLRQAKFGNKTRHVLVRARDVGGVSVGHPVVIRGVRAGRVERIELGERGWVVLSLGLDPDVTMPADPVVMLVASSLFGEWQATITDGAGVPADRELRALIAEARSKSDTLPGAALPDIAQLTSVAGRIAGDVAQVAERVQVAFDDQAARELRESIRNFATLSNELSRTVTEQSKHLGKLSEDVQRGVLSVNEAAARINRFTGRVDSTLTEADLRQIVSNTRQAASELVKATARLNTVAEGAEKTEARLAAAVARADSVLVKVNGKEGTLGLMVNDPHLYQSTDSLVRELRALIVDVRSNPRRYFNLKVF